MPAAPPPLTAPRVKVADIWVLKPLRLQSLLSCGAVFGILVVRDVYVILNTAVCRTLLI